jgi:hypothetical protein
MYRGLVTSAKGGVGNPPPNFVLTGIQWDAVNMPPNRYSFLSGGSDGGAPARATLNEITLDPSKSAWNDMALTASLLLDPMKTCVGLGTYQTGPLGPYWNRYIAQNLADASSDKNDNVYAMDYRYAQDDGGLIVVYDRQQKACSWLDVTTMQVGEFDGTTVAPVAGFSGLPAPSAPMVTAFSTDGNLTCGTSYSVQVTYTVAGPTFAAPTVWAGESLPSPATVVATQGSGATCRLRVSQPAQTPGGSSLTLTATGYNVYACPGACQLVPPTLQTNGSNPHPLAQPVIASMTSCNMNGKTQSYDWYLVATNAGGASITSQAFTPMANGMPVQCRNYNPTAIINWTADPSCTLMNPCTYYLLRSDPGAGNRTVMACSVSVPAKAASCTDNTNYPSNFVNQTNPITTPAETATITSLSTSGPTVPSIGSAGIRLHNIRMTEDGSWIELTASDALNTTQPMSAAKAPSTISMAHRKHDTPAGEPRCHNRFKARCELRRTTLDHLFKLCYYC